MTIGFVTTSFPRSETDFAGRFVFELARAFSRRGYRVEVVLPEPPESPHWDAGAPWLEGISVHRAPYARPAAAQKLFYGAGVPDNIRRGPWVLGLIPPAVFGLSRVLIRRAPKWDAVMSHWLLPSALVAGLARQRGMRHLAIAHSGDVHLLTRPFLKHLSFGLLRSADCFGFISEGLRRRFLASLPRRLTPTFARRSMVTPMGVDVAELTPDRERTALRRALRLSRFTVLFMGRLVPIKGTSLLLQALSTLPDMDLLVAGDGPERARLARLSNRLGVAARFIGTVPPKMRRDVMGACDALALPSCTLTSGRREGLPLVLPEAMAAGLPVIASDTGAVREFVSHRQNGLIFREGDVDGLRHCLCVLRTDVDMRESLRREGRASARARDWQNMLPMFESLLFTPHAPCSRNGLEERHDF